MVFLSAQGYIQVHVFTSTAQLPLRDAAVAITGKDGGAIAMRLTDSSGMLSKPVEIQVPEEAAGQSPDTGTIPYTAVDLYARAEGYEEIFIRDLQVFPGVITDQKLEMIPLSEYPASWNRSETFDTGVQNL